MKLIKVSKDKTVRVPSISEIASLLQELKSSIGDGCRAFDDAGDDMPGIQVTVGSNESGKWSYQTGDNSFMGSAYHYPFWSVVSLYRRSNCKELAKDLQDQLIEVQI